MEELNPTGMYGRVELITPERAERDLASMPKNRNLRWKRVEMYCRAREHGDWILTHQGIAYDCDGRLRDGQHRLQMVVKTGKPTVMFVVYNVPNDAFMHMDEQLPRSIREALSFAGRGDFSTSVIAVAGIIETVPRFDVATMMRDRDYILRMLRGHPRKLAFAEEHAKGVGLTRAVRALAARAYAHADRERLAAWCRILRTGMPEDPNKDMAAIQYRNVLLRMGALVGAEGEREKYMKGQTALQSFLKYTPLTKVYGTEKDLFPLKEECDESSDLVG